jgi:hypothetical protein
VVNPCIGGHFDTSLRTCPLLGGTHQCTADSLATERLIDEPTFYEAHGICGIAAVGVRAQTGLKEAGELAGLVMSDKDCSRKSTVVAGCEEKSDLPAVFAGGRVGPQQRTHLRDLIRIMELCWPDCWICHRVDYLVKRPRSMESAMIL